MLSFADWNGMNVEEEGHLFHHGRPSLGSVGHSKKLRSQTDLVINFQEIASVNVEIKDVMYSTETAGGIPRYSSQQN